jgi:hypothetical protein
MLLLIGSQDLRLGRERGGRSRDKLSTVTNGMECRVGNSMRRRLLQSFDRRRGGVQEKVREKREGRR